MTTLFFGIMVVAMIGIVAGVVTWMFTEQPRAASNRIPAPPVTVRLRAPNESQVILPDGREFRVMREPGQFYIAEYPSGKLIRGSSIDYDLYRTISDAYERAVREKKDAEQTAKADEFVKGQEEALRIKWGVEQHPPQEAMSTEEARTRTDILLDGDPFE